MTQSLTRLAFLNWIGAVGGSAAVYPMALALGLMPGKAGGAPRRVRPLGGGTKRSIALLGGGMSSLMCAYELERAGYQCTILEASHRIGGRNMTLRSGDLIDETGHPQRCQFDDHPDLYFNAGAARIPAHHHYVVHYCKELAVPLEPFTNVNYNAWVQDDNLHGGKPVRFRQLVTDARGFIAELSAKAISADAFDAGLSAEDVERVRQFLRSYGDLDSNLLYEGSNRGGHLQPGVLAPTADMLERGTLPERLDFSEILRSDFWKFDMHFGELEDQAAAMMQPVGGMDNIVKGFVAKIKSPMLTRAQVKAIHIGEDGVRVVYQHKGQHQELKADYCLNCIPAHLLVGIDNNFPREYTEALSSLGRAKLFKIGIQMRERFWEDENIFGGITWTHQNIEQMWYPSHGIHGGKGVMLGAYTFDPENADFFAWLSPAERFEAALWTPETRARYFRVLQQPLNGRHFMMGDQISYHPGWQEGAFSSAHHALNELQRRVRGERAAA